MKVDVIGKECGLGILVNVYVRVYPDYCVTAAFLEGRLSDVRNTKWSDVVAPLLD